MIWLIVASILVIFLLVMAWAIYEANQYGEIPDDPMIQVMGGQVDCPRCGSRGLDLVEAPSREEYRCSNCGVMRIMRGIL